MWRADLVAPVAASHRHDGQLGENDGTTDGRGHLLRALDAEADVAVVVADGHDGAEARTLTGLSLLLHGLDLEHLVLEHRRIDEAIHNLRLLLQ